MIKKNAIILMSLIILMFSCGGNILDQLTNILSDNKDAEILTPHPGALFHAEDECVISWKKIKGNSLKIELYFNEELKETLKDSEPNIPEKINELKWKIRKNITTGAGYRIKFTIQDHLTFEGKTFFSEAFAIETTSWRPLPPVTRNEACQASVSMVSEKTPLVSLIYTKEDGFVYTELLQFNGEDWKQATNNPQSRKAHFLLTEQKNDGQPVILSQGINLASNNKHDFIIQSYDGTQWQSLGDLPADGMQSSEYISICTSMAVNHNNETAVTMLAIPEEYIENKETGYIPLYSFNCNASGGSFGDRWKIIDIGSLFLTKIDNDFLQFYPELYPSVGLYEDGTPVVALVNALISSGISEKRIYCYEKNASRSNWLGKTSVSDGPADSPAMAISKDNKPAVIFRDLSNEGRARVKRWTGSEWEDLGLVQDFEGQPFSFSNEDLPAIAVDRNNRIIAASTAGVYRWNDKAEEWDCLGFPNHPGYTGKKTKKWLAVSDEAIAVCHVNGEEPNLVQVKILEY